MPERTQVEQDSETLDQQRRARTDIPENLKETPETDDAATEESDKPGGTSGSTGTTSETSS